jgi:hypothetical protein
MSILYIKNGHIRNEYYYNILCECIEEKKDKQKTEQHKAISWTEQTKLQMS